MASLNGAYVYFITFYKPSIINVPFNKVVYRAYVNFVTFHKPSVINVPFKKVPTCTKARPNLKF